MKAFAPSPADRREIQRQLADNSTITFASETGEIVVARTKNLSIKGTGILTSHYFGPGTSIRIHVMAPGSATANFLPAEVRHATAQREGLWLLGCHFSRLITVKELSAFG